MSLATDTGFDRLPLPLSTTRSERLAPYAIVALGLFFMLQSNVSALLGDPDSQWHVAIGRWIVAHGSVPATDLFSHTYAGSPWIAKEWVSQLALYAAYELGGWRGVALATSLVLSGSFTLLFAWATRRMRWTAALVAMLAAFALSEMHMLARPHVLVMPIIIAWMIALVDGLERGTAPRLPAVLLMIAWANMHGSFPFGLVMGGVLAAEGVVFAPAGTRATIARRWAVFLALSYAATTLSPFGWRAVLVPLKMFGNAETLQYVDEWRPLQADALGIMAIAALVATGVILALDARRNIFRIVAAGLVAYLMVRHSRFVSLFGLVSPILVARSLGARLPPVPLAPPFWMAPAAGAMAVVAAIVVVVANPQPGTKMTPQAAFDFAMAHGVHGNVYNDYNFGGFLIAHDVKTFVDGRTDQLFLGDFMPRLEHALDAKDDAAFASILAKAEVQWALVKPQKRTTDHFDRLPGWKRIYADADAAVYVSR